MMLLVNFHIRIIVLYIYSYMYIYDQFMIALKAFQLSLLVFSFIAINDGTPISNTAIAAHNPFPLHIQLHGNFNSQQLPSCEFFSGPKAPAKSSAKKRLLNGGEFMHVRACIVCPARAP